MKRNSCVLITVLIALFFVVSCKGPDSTSRYTMLHVGTWSGVDSTNTKGVVTFRENGTGTMEYGGNTYDFQYFFDYSKKPVFLDLLYSREGKPFQARLIVRYMDENKFQWYTFFTDVRPTSFPETQTGMTMTLTRMNSLTKA